MEFAKAFYFLILGTVFLVTNIVNCQIPTKVYSSYQPSPHCNPSDYMRYPKNADEIVAIVKEAITSGKKVKAFGSRHSQTDIICTDGIPVDMKKIRFAQMNADGTATFGAGITLERAVKFLSEHDRAFKVTPAFLGITLGGAIGTGAHGSSIKHTSSLSEQVIRMNVVNGRGEKMEISDPKDLQSFKVHLGLLGIIVDITFSPVPLYKILAHNHIVSDDILTNGDAVKWAKKEDQINFHWFPSFKQVVVVNLTFVSPNTPGNAVTNAISPATNGYFNVFTSRFKEISYDLSSSECAIASALGNSFQNAFEIVTISALTKNTLGVAPIYTEDGKSCENPAVGYAHSMLATGCSEKDAGFFGRACIWAHGDLKSNVTVVDNEMAIALDDLTAFVLATKDIVKKTPTHFPLQGLRFRFSGKTNIHMSLANQRDTVHVEFLTTRSTDFYNKASASIAGYQTILQTLARRFNGRTHWGKTGAAYHSAEMIKLKLDKNALENFTAAMRKFDPNQLFLNNFGSRLTQTGTKMDLDPKIIHCALLDNCFCSKDGDCGTTQTCTNLPGYNFTVCKTRNELPAVQFKKSLFGSNYFLNWLSTTLASLIASLRGKCSIPGVLVNTIPKIFNSLTG